MGCCLGSDGGHRRCAGHHSFDAALDGHIVFLRFFGTLRSNDWEDTFALLNGGRAVSENLQLDRILPTTRVDMLTVALDSLKGITVKEFDWAPLTKGIDPKLDPLARLIPDDQHALFFSSYVSLAALASEAAAQGGSVLEVGEPRAESAYVRQRYRRQLCLLRLDLRVHIASLLRHDHTG